MYSVWTEHLKDPEDKQRFELTVQSAKPVLDRVLELIEKDELALNRSVTDIRSFDTPNWSEKRAFKDGCQSYMQTIKKLINLDQQRKTNDPRST